VRAALVALVAAERLPRAEVERDPAYSYYAAGFRVTKIVGDELAEVGHYIDVGGNNFGGVLPAQRPGAGGRQRSRLRSLHHYTGM